MNYPTGVLQRLNAIMYPEYFMHTSHTVSTQLLLLLFLSIGFAISNGIWLIHTGVTIFSAYDKQSMNVCLMEIV